MSLVKCAECSNEISSEAKTCPMCGIVTKKRIDSKNIIVGVIIVFVVVVLIALNKSKEESDSFPDKTLEQLGAEYLQQELDRNEKELNRCLANHCDDVNRLMEEKSKLTREFLKLPPSAFK